MRGSTSGPPVPGIEAPVTVRDLAQLIGISEAKAYSLIRAGEIEAIHIGRSVRITPAAIRRFLGNEAPAPTGIPSKAE